MVYIVIKSIFLIEIYFSQKHSFLPKTRYFIYRAIKQERFISDPPPANYKICTEGWFAKTKMYAWSGETAVTFELTLSFENPS